MSILQGNSNPVDDGLVAKAGLLIKMAYYSPFSTDKISAWVSFK